MDETELLRTQTKQQFIRFITELAMQEYEGNIQDIRRECNRHNMFLGA